MNTTEIPSPQPAPSEDWAMGDWMQYAKAGETAQACIERHRRQRDELLAAVLTLKRVGNNFAEWHEKFHPAIAAIDAAVANATGAQASAPAHAALIRRIEAYQRGESQEITRILIDCLAALQAPAVGEREVLDLIATLEAEAHGALLHTAFVSQGLIYTTIKTLRRLAGIPESVVPVQGSES